MYSSTGTAKEPNIKKKTLSALNGARFNTTLAIGSLKIVELEISTRSTFVVSNFREHRLTTQGSIKNTKNQPLDFIASPLEINI